jgi:hypothetical protein
MHLSFQRDRVRPLSTSRAFNRCMIAPAHPADTDITDDGAGARRLVAMAA